MGTSSRAGTGVLCAWYAYCDLGANAGMMQRSVRSRRSSSSSSSSPVLLPACMSKFGLRRSVGAEESVAASGSVLYPRWCALSTVKVRCAAVSTRCAGLVVLAAVLGCLCGVHQIALQGAHAATLQRTLGKGGCSQTVSIA
jgi:hypothetical protein